MGIEELQEKIVRGSQSGGLLAVFLGAAFLFGLTLFGVYQVQEYGAALFVVGPIVHGIIVAGLLRFGSRRRIGSIIAHTLVSLLIYVFVLMLSGLEGLICIVMAAPLAIPGSLLGAAIGHVVFHGAYDVPPGSGLVVVGLVALSSGYIEKGIAGEPETQLVESSMLINAPAEAVWREIVDLKELPEPDDWVFKIGVACPHQTEIRGTGVGAKRHCKLTTGGMPQEINVWEPNRRLGFLAMSTPPPLEEINPFMRVEPPHLHGYFTIERGEYLLLARGDQTLLVRKTWYTSRMRPAFYWGFWSNLVLDRGHMLVIRHVKRVSEGKGLSVKR